ncbi:hypothetical protein EDD28_0102 [Salana multivorans]|uniref:DUF7574 domain-containing protein n=1 Tax=Salana multivorans TaxID=120377 RepID=A0A3N2D6P6_9MICO|nr:hypothetical protein [Salana multivorans]ROR95461.1 hypothetical protein EDD28_0014 [Salana multivorans]ROR95545.1 hypothetical protein EDD28_0102 [Salana multivorans]
MTEENPHIRSDRFRWIDSIDWDEESYQFNMTDAWLDTETGDVLVADDSGCSCPTPFEDTRLNDTTKIAHLKDLDAHVADRMEIEWSRAHPGQAGRVDRHQHFRASVEQALRGGE